MKDLDRRQYLKSALAVSVTTLLAKVNPARAQGGLCEATPSQVEGPFYPGQGWDNADNDLTRIRPESPRAQGTVVILHGVVTGSDCKPLENVLVEIWQACHSGKYNHPGDPNPAPLDPHFQYWGRVLTDSEGHYSFKTIVPGAYQASSTWTRPPHIHLKAHRRGFSELTTQVYFRGHALNLSDRILQSLPPAESDKLQVEFERTVTDQGLSFPYPVGVFNISLDSIE